MSPADAVPRLPRVVHSITLSGEIGVGRERELQGLYEQFLGSGATIAEVDLTEIGFLDSTGLTFLLRLRGACIEHGGRVRLISPQPTVMRLLRLSGLVSAFEIIDR